METLRNAWKSGGKATRIIVVVAGILLSCCLGTIGITASDAGMRAAGILPTYTLTPWATLPPTETATPTDTATSTSTPEPTATQEPTATYTPRPTATDRATDTPAQIETPRPTNTPQPTATRQPLPTATPAPPTAEPPTAVPPTPVPPTAVPPTAAPQRDYLGAGVWWCPSSLEGAAYVGSVGSDAFHSLGCSSVKQIAEHNRICYESRDAAVAYGKRPCQRCKP